MDIEREEAVWRISRETKQKLQIISWLKPSFEQMMQTDLFAEIFYTYMLLFGICR